VLYRLIAANQKIHPKMEHNNLNHALLRLKDRNQQLLSDFQHLSNLLQGSFPPSSIQSDSTGSGGGHDNGSGNRIGPPSLPSSPNNDHECLYTLDDLNLCGEYDDVSGMYTGGGGVTSRSSLSLLGSADDCDNGGGVGVSNVEVVPDPGGDIRVVHRIDPPPLPSIRNNNPFSLAGTIRNFPPLPPRLPLDLSSYNMFDPQDDPNQQPTVEAPKPPPPPKTSQPPSSSNNITPPEQPKTVNHKRGLMASETTENGTVKKARSSSNSSTNATTNPNANYQNIFGYTGVEKYTGCLVSHQYSGIGDTDAIIKRFLDDCQSRDFATNCLGFGFLEAKFHPNPHLTDAGNARRQKFSQSIASDSMELEKRSAHLGMVFHGTHKSNIESILKDGLDIEKRKGQTFGPGEYFSTNPGTSVSFCKGGLEMLVFVVVIPPVSERNIICPSDYVIVDNNCYQLPLGVLKFTSVDHEVSAKSNARRREYFDLCMEVRTKTQIKEETKIKADIIKKIIMEDIDSAAQTYENKDSLLTELSRKEVSWYVNKHLDKNVIPAFFPNLPNPMTLDEMRGVRLHNLENAVEEEKEAKDKLEVAQKHYPLLPSPLLPQQQHHPHLYHPLPTYPPFSLLSQQQHYHPSLHYPPYTHLTHEASTTPKSRTSHRSESNSPSEYKNDELVPSLTKKIKQAEGMWYSDDFYDTHGREWVKVSATCLGTGTPALVAVQITGDPNVPAGCTTWKTLSWPKVGGEAVPAEIQMRADPNDPHGFEWIAGRLEMVKEDQIVLLGGTFYKQNDDEESSWKRKHGTNIR